ncbi:p-loop containing nucleoside triphosphate hydrolase protein [Pleurostoma richardsiae]|uniref:P-loop containing nucleoside triphosphate hydrolase protein n=1 Tax=Pleurostoma richardsiae TaxID=41990 RepID=A0AA38VTG4_9PEZI|nr:p-loop containing nucleoside triphosphate hydrolase protein [Pleurostoma richardsiae]
MAAATTQDDEKKKEPEVPKQKKPFFVFFRLLLSASPTPVDILLLITGVIGSIAAGVPFPLLGILFGELIDDINSSSCSSSSSSSSLSSRLFARSDSSNDDPQSSVNHKVLLVVYITIAYFGLIFVYIQSLSVFGSRLAHRLRDAYFASLLRQEVSYFDALPAGEVASRLSADIEAVRAGTSEKVGVWLYSVSFFVTAYVVAFMKDAKLAGMLLSLVPAFMAMSLVGGHYVGKFAGAVSDRVASASSIALEGLANVMVVQAFGAEGRLEERFATELRGARRDGVKKAIATGLQAGVLYFVAYAASGLAFWQGSRHIAAAVGGDGGGVSVGAIYTVIFILVDATIILSTVSPYLQIFGSATAAFTKLEEGINRKSNIDATEEPALAAPSSLIEAGDVEVRGVTFAYPSRPEVQVLRNVSLNFPAGQHTAIVGLSGSGKSTIAGLLTRLYDPADGGIFIGGQDIKTVNTRHLRSMIGLVQQDPLLLDRSLLENIAHGLVNSSNPGHEHLRSFILGPELGEIADLVRSGQSMTSAAEMKGSVAVEVVSLVQRAADLADVTTFAQTLERGFGTTIGPGGDRLSGGQRQRVALARALVKDPKIVVLDEATAALDSATEQRIQGAMEKISQGRTLITIAHRLATVRHAANIIVMGNGKVLEQGTHEVLIAKNGHYASLVRQQSVESADAAHWEEEETEGTQGHHEIARAISKKSAIEESKEHLSDSSTEKHSEEAQGKTPPAVAKKEANTYPVLKRLGALLRPYLLWLFLGLIAAIVVAGSYTGEAFIFGNTVSALSPCKSPSSIRSRGAFFGLMFFILALIELAANALSWSLFGWTAERLLYAVRVLSFRSLFEQDLHWHQSEGRTPSQLLGFITDDSSALGGLTGSIIGTVLSICINLIAAVIVTLIVAWKIALVCLAVVPLMLGSGLMQLRQLSAFAARHEAAFARSISISVEAVNSIRAVAALGLEGEVLGTYRRSLGAPKREIARASAVANFWLALAYSIGYWIYALAYWWGAKLIIAGEYSQAQFFIVLVALLVSAQLWSQMFTLAPELTKANAAVARIVDLIDQGKSKTLKHPGAGSARTGGVVDEADIEGSGRLDPEKARGTEVKFSDVHFFYPSRPDVEVLKGLSLSVQPGQFCALVGPSGAGKSTVFSLLLRMFPISSGRITLDGLDISSSTDPAFRNTIGLVPQAPVLFDGTVRFNVALGSQPGREATQDEIEAACRVANIHDTIASLPEGYDTRIGPNGGQLSGGQRQRLAIARALVRLPRLLLLDESTSALDAESERLLGEGLERVRAGGGTTVLCIAHRLSTVRRADVICCVEDGRVADRGTHEELLGRSDSYRLAVAHQTLEG